jgi:hypothetical protein
MSPASKRGARCSISYRRKKNNIDTPPPLACSSFFAAYDHMSSMALPGTTSWFLGGALCFLWASLFWGVLQFLLVISSSGFLEFAGSYYLNPPPTPTPLPPPRYFSPSYSALALIIFPMPCLSVNGFQEANNFM